MKELSARYLPKNKILYWLIVFGLIFLKLWLIESQPLFAIGRSPHDDRLFLTLASYLLKGEWLGPYDSLTLVKGPFFPLWIAITFSLKIPLLLSGQILYAVSCLVLTHSLKPLFKKDVSIILFFAILLFNPASYDASLTRVSREAIYPALSVLVTACAFGVFFSDGDDRKKTWPWKIGLGITFASFWLTREEGVWVIPFLFFMVCCKAMLAYQSRNFRKVWFSFKPWLTSFMISSMLIISVNVLNYVHYGVFAKTEMETHSFKAAYGALSRVKPAKPIRYVPVTKETRRRIYEVSPAFKELARYLEGRQGRIWSDLALGQKTPENKREILGGWFTWAFRSAVADRGYYDGKYPEDYYLRLAKEVNEACENGKLDCYPERDTVFPIWHWYYGKYVAQGIIERLSALARFAGISADPIQSTGTTDELALFLELTNEEIVDPNLEPADTYLPNQKPWDTYKLTILKWNLHLYQFILPAFVVYTVIAYLFMLITWLMKRGDSRLLILLSSLIVLFFTRLLLLSLLNAISWQIPVLAYLHPLHAILLMFIGLKLTLDFETVLVNRKLSRLKKGNS